ncbi:MULTISPECIES: response regulator transcription factor [unclassified Pseudomonas]|uniref:response regulator transcription factor n=1 Tax=unclassified Pseudomonas TaxID=196821 RepID=UPI000885E52F|nr:MULTISPECIES: response regulator transcription factor [unclassified Pseudomonas]UVL58128.1 response regulator transcription factor [Pseudomonas sp. B21-035]SDQ83796.1 two component transcriptional regulator, winged helix family [Pseudomonas sp. UC 17F4]
MIEILLVEDDRTLAGSLADYLSEVGFDIDFAFNGQTCLERTLQQRYDAIVMDVTMPGLDGLRACKALRKRQDQTPILFLTARDALADKLDGYEAGADDYLIKPFEPQELVCRLHALLRRGKLPSHAEQLQCGELLIDLKRQMVYRQGIAIELQEVPIRLLSLLAEAAPDAVSRKKLENALWPDELPESDPLRSHIYRLRQALDRPFERELVKTVHGKGYRLAIPD